MRLESSNPILTSESFQDHSPWYESAASKPRVMTYGGVAIKTSMLLATAIAVGVASFQFLAQNQAAIMLIAVVAFVAGFITLFAVRARPAIAPIVAFPFAALEGAFASGFTVWVMNWIESRPGSTFQPSMVIEAIMITAGLLGLMLAAFAAGLIRIEGIFKRVLCFAIAGLMMYYVLGFVLSLVGIPIFRAGWDSGPIGIGFSVFVIGIASLSLVLDFQEVEAGVKSSAPKQFEWVVSIGLMMTLVWIYIEVLRLLAKLRD